MVRVLIIASWLPFLLAAATEGLAHGAHEHGKANLGLAIEGKVVRGEFESPAVNLYGFEHEARSPEQIAARDGAAARFRHEIGNMIVWPKTSECKVGEITVEPFVKGHGAHGEFRARFTASCGKDLKGEVLTFGFWREFPGIEAVQVQVVGEKIQGGGTVSKGQPTLKI